MIKNTLIKYFCGLSCSYITFVLVKEYYYDKRYQKFKLRKKDIENELLNEEDLKEYEFLKKYYDNHMGHIIIKNIHSSKFLIESADEKIFNNEKEKLDIKFKLKNNKISNEEKEVLEKKYNEMEKINSELKIFLKNVKNSSGKYEVYNDDQILNIIGAKEDNKNKLENVEN